MRRRDFIKMAVSSAAAWPIPMRAQQRSRVRRIGVLIGLAAGDPDVAKYLNAFQEALRTLGWTDGKSIQIDDRVSADLDGMRSAAAELIGFEPELIVTFSTPATNAVRQATRSVPIVFVAVSDPLGTGFVESFSRPGGNITGFTNFEATMGSKWVDLICDIAPSVKRVAMLFDPTTANAGASGGIYLRAMKEAARIQGIELIENPVIEPADIDRAFAAMAQIPGGGFIVMPNVFTFVNRERIVAQAARFRIPTVYPLPQFVKAGGLLSYGIDYKDGFRRAASYADRILRGDKPADLPVQQPTKFELAINLKTAKSLDLAVPLMLQVAADELIE